MFALDLPVVHRQQHPPKRIRCKQKEPHLNQGMWSCCFLLESNQTWDSRTVAVNAHLPSIFNFPFSHSFSRYENHSPPSTTAGNGTNTISELNERTERNGGSAQEHDDVKDNKNSNVIIKFDSLSLEYHIFIVVVLV